MPLFNSVNLRSKIIAAMMAAAALTGLTQAWLGNDNVSRAFDVSLDRQLTSVAATTAQAVERYLESARATVVSLGENLAVADALTRFDSAYRSSGSSELNSDVQAALKRYYTEVFAKTIPAGQNANLVVDALLPASPVSRIMQYHYIAANPEKPGEKDKLDKAGDGSIYSQEHARYHPSLRTLRDNFGFADIFLINADGLVVYSVIKEIDFMAELAAGPFSESGLSRAFAAARNNRATRPVVIQDYSFYLPSGGAPSFFIATPVYSGSRFAGVVAVQLLASELDKILSHGGKWADIGLGEGGDLFLLGADGLLRSSVRSFEADPAKFGETAKARGLASVTAEQIEAFRTPINLLDASNRMPLGERPVGAARVNAANFSGDEVRAISMPVDFRGLDWRVVAEMPIAEAGQPVSAFQRLMMLALALTVTLTTIGAMLLASRITRPLKAMAQKLSGAAGGDLDQDIALSDTDEIGDLSRSAQELVDSLNSKIGSVEKERLDTHDLLSRFLPDGIVRLVTSRKQKGDDDLDDIAELVRNASFVYASLSGYEDMLAKLTPEQAVKALDDLVQVVDIAAEKHGVEKVRTAGETYFAVAGLSGPHIDHRQRALDFARDLRDIVDRFRRDSGAPVVVKVGIASGDAVSGVIGRHKLAFDMWGKPVDECRLMNERAAPGEIRVTAEFAEAMAEAARFTRPADTSVTGLALAITGAHAADAKPASSKAAGKARRQR